MRGGEWTEKIDIESGKYCKSEKFFFPCVRRTRVFASLKISLVHIVYHGTAKHIIAHIRWNMQRWIASAVGGG